MSRFTADRKLIEICPFLREAGAQKGDSWKNRSRRIYDHELMYCQSGDAHITIDKRYYHITPGTLVLIPPNTPHSFWVDENNLGEVYYIHFDFFYRDDYDKLYDYLDVNIGYVNLFGNKPLNTEHVRENPTFEGGYVFPEYLKVNDTDKVEQIFRRACKAYSKKATGWSLYCKMLVSSLFELIYVQTNEEENYSSINHREMVAQMKFYIAKNYYKKMYTYEVANSTGMCAEYASRVFKKVCGLRLVEYIIRFRISKAKELMLEMDLTLEQIAYMVGFENENYFSQKVKEYEGLTPAALRASLIRELNL